MLANRGLQSLTAAGQQTALGYVGDEMHRWYADPGINPAWFSKNDDERVAVIERLVAEGLRRGRAVSNGEVSTERDRAAEVLQGRGVNTNALAALNEGEQATLREALRSTSTDLSTLDQRLRDNAAALSTFRTAVAAAETALGAAGGREREVGAPGTVLRRADGGFTPRGTDTVPAMLTPGEFVVNRDSTQANLALLRRINAAKGPVQYHEDGGYIRQGVEGYLWMQRKMNQAGNWVSSFFADGGEVLRQRWRDAHLRAYGAEMARGDSPSSTVIGPGGVAAPTVIPALDAGQASYRAVLRRREEAAYRRYRAAVDPQAPRQMTPAEALANNRAFNAGAMGFSQALARSGMDDGQVGAAMGSVGQLRDFEYRQFMGRWGTATAGLRMRDTAGWRDGAGVRAAAETAERRRAWVEANRPRLLAEYRELRNAAYSTEVSRGLDTRGPTVGGVGVSVIPALDAGQASQRAAQRRRLQRYERLLFADGGIVPGTGTRDTVPAMLTPGEGVLNLRAMSALGPGFVHRFNAGGVVPGGAAGGSGPGASGLIGLSPEARAAMDQFAGHTKDLGTALAGFAAPANLLASALHGFNAGAEKLAGALEKFNGEVSHTYQGNITVDLNGAEALNALKGELQTDLTAVVMRQVVDYVGRMLPDAPRPHQADPTRLT